MAKPAPVATPTAPLDLLRIENIIDNIQEAQQEMIAGLKVDYGAENFQNVFAKTGCLVFQSPNGGEHGPLEQNDAKTLASPPQSQQQ